MRTGKFHSSLGFMRTDMSNLHSDNIAEPINDRICTSDFPCYYSSNHVHGN